MKFSDGSRNNYMQGSSHLSTPHYSQLTLRIHPATNGLNMGRQNGLCTLAQETLGTLLLE